MRVEEKLKNLIDDKNITIKELAKLIGKTRNTVYSYLRGDSSIDVNSLMMICEEYEIPISYFLKDDEKKSLFREIEKLKDEIDRLEFYLSGIILEQIDHSKREIPLPSSIYEYPQIVALQKKYNLYKQINKKSRGDS